MQSRSNTLAGQYLFGFYTEANGSHHGSHHGGQVVSATSQVILRCALSRELGRKFCGCVSNRTERKGGE